MVPAPAVLIIGIGSPFGDDRFGPEAIAALRRDPYLRAQAHRVSLLAADRPGPRLIDMWSGAGAVLLIDAVVTGAPAGTVHRLDGEAIVCAGRRNPSSSHGFGVAETVALARQLGVAPERMVLYGIEIAGTSETLAPTSAMDAAATTRLTVQVVEEVRRWLDEDADKFPKQ